MKRYLALGLALIIAFSSFTYAIPNAQKTETVYVNMDYYGNINQINISNEFTLFGQEEVKDFANYDEITYFTEANYNETTKTFSTKGMNRLSYSGKINPENSKNIPWNFDISYKLNGVPVSAEQLLNANGLVEMLIDIKPNKNADDYYKNNYMLEITSSFDMTNYLSVESEDAIEVSTGKTKTLMFVVLPGQTKTISIKMGSEKFEFEGLTFAMLPLTGDILTKVYELVEDKRDFEDAMESLNDSTDVVLYALNNMSGSILKLQEGIQLLEDGTNSLHSSSANRNENIEKLSNSIQNISSILDTSKDDIDKIKEQVNDLNDLLVDMNKHLKALVKDVNHLEKVLAELEDVVEKLPDDLYDIRSTLKTSKLLINDLKSLLLAQSQTNNVDVTAIENKMNEIASELQQLFIKASQLTDDTEKNGILVTAQELKVKLDELGTQLEEVKNISGNANNASTSLYNHLTALEKNISEINNRITKMIDDDADTIIDLYETGEVLVSDLNDVLKTLRNYSKKFVENKDYIPNSLDNINHLLSEAQDFCNSTVSVIDSLETTLKVLDNELYEGTIKVTDSLINASSDLNKITSESNNFKIAKDKAKDVIKDKWNEIDEKTTIFNVNPDAEVVSFASNENEAPTKVQIVLKSPEINEDTIEIEDLEPQKVKESVWSRIVAVFVKLFEKIKNLFK